VVWLTACAGDGEREAFNRAVEDQCFDALVAWVGLEMGGESAPEVARWYERSGEVWRAHADRLRRITPPAEVRKAYAAWVAELEGVAAAFGRVAEIIRLRPNHAVRVATARVWARMGDAARSARRLGFERACSPENQLGL
jgi:hypothetical protein